MCVFGSDASRIRDDNATINACEFLPGAKRLVVFHLVPVGLNNNKSESDVKRLVQDITLLC